MIQLDTLGTVDLRRDGVESRSVLAQPKRLALLAYLACAAPRGFHPRDVLLGLFWPESDTERARNSLRQALHYLRRSLGEDAVASRGDREVGVDPERLRCDAAEFDRALEEGRPEDALALYRGDFLPGLYVEDAPEAERWIDEERARRRRAAVSAATDLAAREEARGEVRAAATWAARAAALAPHDEAAARRHALLLEAAGEHTAALEALAGFTRRLEQEIGVPPSEDLRQLAERLRTGPRAPVPPPPRPVPPVSSIPSIASTPSSSNPPAERHESGDRAPGADRGLADDRAVADGSDGRTAPASFPPGQSPTSDSAPSPMPATTSTTVPMPTDEAHPPIRPAEPALAPGGWKARWGRYAAAAALVVGLGGAGWMLRGAGEGAADERAEAAEAPSIAVLPFLNLSGDPGREHFSDGISEELLNVLAQVPGLRVASRTSSFAFKGKDVGTDSIGRALRVGHVLEGSVRAHGDSVRVTAQLIDTRTGYHLWSRNYDRELRDVFAVQDEISHAIVEALHLELQGRRAVEPLVRQETDDVVAFELLLKSGQVLREGSPEAHTQAVAFLEEALQRDPGYARAVARLADVWLWRANRRFVAPEEGYAKAERYARRAMEMDPAIPEPYTTLAWIAQNRREWAEAERYYARAIELTPGYARNHAHRAVLLMRLGRADEALESARRAVELEPTWPGWHNAVAAVHYYAGRPDQAIAAHHAALELQPGRPHSLTALGMTLAAFGRPGAAEPARRGYEGARSTQHAVAVYAYALAREGRRAQAEAVLRELEALPDPSPYLRAEVYLGLGNAEEALRLLTESVEGGEDAAVDLARDPVFAPLRGDARFQALVRRIGVG